MQQKKIISGLDVVKFIMAFLIVDSHVKGYLITHYFSKLCNTSY